MKGVTSQYMFDSANYDNITRWIYEQGPEYREKKDRDLEERLVEARNESDLLRVKLAETERKLNETARESRSTAGQVSFLSGIMEKLLGWIRTVFGVNLF